MLVNEILPETIALYSQDSRQNTTYSELKYLKTHLDKQANILKQEGFTVDRIPMPAHEYNTFRTYSNFLIVNGFVLFPDYLSSHQTKHAGEAELARTVYKPKIATVLRKYGIEEDKIKWFNFDDIIVHKGSLHCVTMQIPR